MRQLGELQGRYADIQSQNAEVLAVFREEKMGAKGLRSSKKGSKASYVLLNDLGAKKTSKYSTQGFDVYVVDKKGSIRAILTGTKSARAKAAAVVKEVGRINGGK